MPSFTPDEFLEALTDAQRKVFLDIQADHPELTPTKVVSMFEDRVTETGGAFQIFQALLNHVRIGATDGQIHRLTTWKNLFDAAKQPYPVTNTRLAEGFADKREMTKVITSFEKVGKFHGLRYPENARTPEVDESAVLEEHEGDEEPFS